MEKRDQEQIQHGLDERQVREDGKSSKTYYQKTDHSGLIQLFGRAATVTGLGRLSLRFARFERNVKIAELLFAYSAMPHVKPRKLRPEMETKRWWISPG